MVIARKVIISPCRCASTTLENCLAQDETLRVVHQPIKYGILRRGVENYRIFLETPLGARALIFKETIGSRRLQTSQLVIFPVQELIKNTDQVFLFREPLSTWRSWLKCGYENLNFFLISYQHAFNLLKKSLEVAPERVTCLTQDIFLETPEEVLKVLCAKWEIVYREKMLKWERMFGSDFCLIEMPKNTRIGIKKGIFDGLIRSNTVIRSKPELKTQPTDEREVEVIRQLAAIYDTACRLSHRDFFR